MQARPYITFKGECREAMELYTRAFNTQVYDVSLFEDVPQTADGSLEILAPQSQWILQATIKFGDSYIRLNDCLCELNDAPSERVAIAVECSEDEVKHAFAVLSEQGKVGIPLKQTFYSRCAGVVIDKFGVMWNLWAPAEE